jgi:hypothetical protein
MWYMKDLVDRAQVALILWHLRRRRGRSTIGWLRTRSEH